MTNRLMQRAGEDALTHARPRTVWERLPVWPRIFGRMLIRSQAPTATRKFVTSSVAQPASSDIAPDVVQRFVDQHGELVAWITDAHSQPLETLGIKPTLEELKKDWATLEAARKAYLEK